MSQDDSQVFILPPSVITKIDVSRLAVEMERIDSDLVTRDARMQSGAAVTDQVKFSEQMTDFLAANNLEIGDNLQRMGLIRQLREIKAKAPVIHITFASQADQETLRQLVVWLRSEVHPQSIMTVGLQPALIGGAYIRTTNKVFDFSLRSKLAGHRDIITREVEALSGSN